MYRYQCFTATMWVLFSIHSTYGYVWLLKDILIPDKNFRAPLAKSTGTGVFLGFFFLFGLLLTPYYSFGYYAASSGVELPPYVLAVAISFW